MGHSKTKHARKAMTFYRIHFGFEEPYQMIADPEFLHVALAKQVFVKTAVPELLKAKTTLVVTKCVRASLRKLGPDYGGAALMAKRMQHVKCDHADSPIDAAECIFSILSAGSEKFCAGIQDDQLRRKVRRVPGIPVMYINNNALVLESPSKASKQQAQKLTDMNLLPSQREQRWLEFKAEERKTETEEEKKGNKRVRVLYGDHGKVKKKAKGPNPLSVKKKKKKPNNSQANASGKKRKREEGGGETKAQQGGGAEPQRDGGGADAAASGEGKHKRKRKRTRVHKKRPGKGEKGQGAAGGGEKVGGGEPAASQ